jgi:hypothetical protein
METKIKDLILKNKNLILKEDCNYFINLFKNNISKTNSEQSYKYKEKKILTDNFQCLNLSEISFKNKNFMEPLQLAGHYISKMVFNYGEYLKKEICPTYDLSNIVYTQNIRIIRYKKGELIKDHSDVGKNIRASCTLNLNEEYEGGEFRFFDGKIRESFKTGDAMIFPAEPIWIHGTEPITKGERYCINCFLGTKE